MSESELQPEPKPQPELVPVGPGPGGEPHAGGEEDIAGGPDAGGATVADLEALLFVAERPLSRAELRALTHMSVEEVDERLGDLEVELRDRGIRLVISGEQVMLGTSPESGQLIARYLGADTVRLSPAALETLAIIAYRQPVTRGVIERIRGVDTGHVVRGLLHRRLILEQGRAETPGRPILYGTSMEFMERFGLTSLDDLPPLEAEIAAQLAQAEEDSRAETSGGPAVKDEDGDEGDDADSDDADSDGDGDGGAADADA